MSGDNAYESPNMNNVSLQNQSFHCSSAALESPLCPNSSSAFHDLTSAVTFGAVNGVSNVDGPKFQSIDSDYNGCLQRPRKRMKLTAAQVQFLEKNIENQDKLKPERKAQLAEELGLKPREVAVWFANWRTRSKKKQVGKQYDDLKASHDKLKADYDNLLKENYELQIKVLDLKDKFIIRESEKAKLSSVPDVMSNAHPPASKQEEACLAKSVVVNSDSLGKSLSPPIVCPELEDESCNIEFTIEDILAFMNKHTSF